MAKKDKRFIPVKQPGNLSGAPVLLVDRETGVQYLFYASGYAGGLTVLVDRDGKPLLAHPEDMLDD